MPTLSLYQPPDDPNASHRVAAPGGYEFWRFEGVSGSGDVRFVATLGVGHPAHPEYLRRYARYRRRPTRHAPPVPSEYPCVHFAVYRGGGLLAEFTEFFGGEQFSASPRHPEASAGANAFTREADGTTSLALRGFPAAAGGGPVQSLSAQLTFRPLVACPAQEVPLLVPGPDAGEHHWVVAAPFCDVSGFISATGDNGNGHPGSDIGFRGRGFHDHGYGTGPPGLGLRRWGRGTVLLHDRVLAFHFFQLGLRDAPSAMCLVEAGAAGVRELPAVPKVTGWSDGRSGGAATPREMRIEVRGASTRVLKGPRVLHSGPAHTRLVYSTESPDSAGEAFIEVAAPPRMEWRPATRVDLPQIESGAGERSEAAGA